jgi:hypothetical protein
MHCIESVVSINMQYNCNIFVVHLAVIMCAFVLGGCFSELQGIY